MAYEYVLCLLWRTCISPHICDSNRGVGVRMANNGKNDEFFMANSALTNSHFRHSSPLPLPSNSMNMKFYGTWFTIWAVRILSFICQSSSSHNMKLIRRIYNNNDVLGVDCIEELHGIVTFELNIKSLFFVVICWHR